MKPPPKTLKPSVTDLADAYRAACENLRAKCKASEEATAIANAAQAACRAAERARAEACDALLEAARVVA